ncbi:hypothetical protein IL54_0266 [Sphingobium sp. ba1]|nr:hypothetical protein IL54_0266 [Sphingobium sp. ba1]
MQKLNEGLAGKSDDYYRIVDSD